MSSGDSVYAFGPFRFHAADRTLSRDGSPLPLTPRTAALLNALLANRGRIVTRGELERLVWGDTYVDGNNLHQQIATLRRILGPGPKEWIETVPRRGYRFAPAEEPAPSQPQAVATVSAPHRARARRWVFPIGAALALVILASCIFLLQSTPRPEPLQIESLAVLPLKPLNVARGDDYLPLGVTDALITRLGNLRAVDVRPLSAVHGFQGLGVDALTAGRRLHVDAVLDGTTQTAANRVRLTLRLLEVSSGRQLWSAVYDEPIDDLFLVEDRVSRSVVDVLSPRITTAAEPRRTRSSDPAVVEAYLRGRYHFSRREHGDFEKSEQCFRDAIARDASFAPAWAGLGDALNFLGHVDEAKDAALRALDLDPTLADAHATLGNAYFFHDRDLQAAERAFQKAIELNPSCTNARHWYAYLLAVRGRMPEAMREIEAARRIDPLSLPINTSVGSLLYYAGRYDEAIAAYRRVLDLDPRYPQAEWELGLALAAKGSVTEAERILLRTSVEDVRSSDALAAAWTAALRGDAKVANEVLRRAELKPRRGTQITADGIWIAASYAALGKRDAAFAWLNRAVDAGGGDVVLIGIDPRLRALRSDPRFGAVLRRALSG